MAILVISEPFSKNKRTYVKARCECGNEFEIQKRRIGITNTCGCFKFKHGDCEGSPTVEYRTWSGMIARCENENSNGFDRYGGRGITVCERWRRSFESFLSDMGRRPEGTTIDRINNDGGYSPDNCRWADTKTQQRNRSDVLRVNIGGENVSLPDAAEKSEACLDTIYQRLRKGWSVEDAINRPLRQTAKPRGEARLTIYGKTMRLAEWIRISGITKSGAHYRIKQNWTDKEVIFGKLKK